MDKTLKSISSINNLCKNTSCAKSYTLYKNKGLRFATRRTYDKKGKLEKEDAGYIVIEFKDKKIDSSCLGDKTYFVENGVDLYGFFKEYKGIIKNVENNDGDICIQTELNTNYIIKQINNNDDIKLYNNFNSELRTRYKFIHQDIFEADLCEKLSSIIIPMRYIIDINNEKLVVFLTKKMFFNIKKASKLSYRLYEDTTAEHVYVIELITDNADSISRSYFKFIDFYDCSLF